jgi:hypothetical protein
VQAPPTPRPRLKVRREGVVRWAQLFALCSFAIAQPLYDLLGRNPGFFSRNGAGSRLLVGFALLLVAAPPTILLAGEALVLWLAGRKALRVVHVSLVGLLVALVFLPLIDRVSARTSVVVPLGVVCAAGAAAVFAGIAFVRRFVSWAAVAPVGFLVVFLFASPASGVVSIGRIEPLRSVSLARTPPIVIVRMDEFPLSSLIRPDGTIDAARYPSFAQFARRSTWYRNTTTVSDVTRYAVPAMLTGTHRPRSSGLIATDHRRSLFTALGTKYAFRGGTEGICPPSVCPEATLPYGGNPVKVLGRLTYEASIAYGHVVAPASLRRGLPASESLGLGTAELPATPVGRTDAPDARWLEPLARIAAIERGQRPTVDLLTLYLPHRPWSLLPSGQPHSVFDYDVPGLRRHVPWTTDRQAVLNAYQAHLVQVGATDRVLGRLVEHLHASRMYDDALVVVIADHGIGFLPGQPHREDLSEAVLPQIASVPVFIKYPHQVQGELDDRPVEVTDLFPTILDVLGADLGWSFDGKPLTQQFARSRRTVVSSSGKQMTVPQDMERRVRDAARWKYEFTGLAVRPVDNVRKFYAVGPYRGWVGRGIDSFHRRSESALRLRIEDANVYEHVDTDGAAVPAAVTAFAAGRPPPARIVVGVNGRVAAVTRTVRWEGRTRLDALFWPGFLVDGRNTVRLYELDGGDLRPIRRSR